MEGESGHYVEDDLLGATVLTSAPATVSRNVTSDPLGAAFAAAGSILGPAAKPAVSEMRARPAPDTSASDMGEEALGGDNGEMVIGDIDGFAIDSDEEDDMPSNPFRSNGDAEENPESHGSLLNTTDELGKETARPSAVPPYPQSQGQEGQPHQEQQEPVTDHPLRDWSSAVDFSPAPGSTTGQPNLGPARPRSNAGPGGTALASRASSLTSAFGSGLSGGLSGLAQIGQKGLQHGSVYAQKAAHGIQEAADRATTGIGQAVEKINHLENHPGQGAGAPSQARAEVVAQVQAQAQALPKSGQQTAVLNPASQQQVSQQAQAPAQPQAGEMDNAKKSALISSALAAGGSGGLLPGERVVAFISPLTSARDSASPQTYVGSEYLDELAMKKGIERVRWCCAITFYRVVVFSYLVSEFEDEWWKTDVKEKKKGAEAEGERKMDGFAGEIYRDGEAPASINEAAVDAVISTASVSRRYQLARANDPSSHGVGGMKKHNGEMGRHHHVMQIPLSSIDRVDRINDLAASALIAQTSGGIGGFANNLQSAMGGVPFPNPGSHSLGAVVPSSAGATSSSGLGLALIGKDNGRFLRFVAPNYTDAVRAHEVLNTYAFPGRRNLGYLFAFESRREEVMASVVKGGGAPGEPPQRITSRATERRYISEQEFGRMGALSPRLADGSGVVSEEEARKTGRPTYPSPWAPVAVANAQYGLCPSYPAFLVGPATISDAHPDGLRLLRKVAAFRSEGRMPVMTWGSSIDGASLWRSSQPRVGLQGNRSAADERYLRLIAEGAAAASSASPASLRAKTRHHVRFLKMLTGGINDEDLLGPQKGGGATRNLLKIMDLRPKSSAIANRTQGEFISTFQTKVESWGREGGCTLELKYCQM